MPHYLAAPISEELATRTLDFVAIIRGADRPRDHRRQAVDLINELTLAGLNGYFLSSCREIGLGRMIEGAVGRGLGPACKAISVLVKRFVGRFDDDQMLKTAGILERILLNGVGSG